MVLLKQLKMECSVAKEIDLDDKFENMGAQMVKRSCKQN